MTVLRFPYPLRVVALGLLGWSGSLAVEPDQAATAEQLEQALLEHPDQGPTLIPRLEAMLIDEVRKNGLGGRFVIKEVAVQGMPGRMTLLGEAGGTVLGQAEFATDQIPIVDNFTQMPFGDGSVQRFTGTVQIAVPLQADRPVSDASPGKPKAKSEDCRAVLDSYWERRQKMLALIDGTGRQGAQRAKTEPVQYTVTGEGDALHRLTFAVLDKIGYVYLRGRGTLVGPNGAEVRLGTVPGAAAR